MLRRILISASMVVLSSCGSRPVATHDNDLEAVVAKCQISMESNTSTELSDGSILVWPDRPNELISRYVNSPNWRTVDEAVAVAEKNPRIRIAALNLAAELVLELVDGPFKIPRHSGPRDCWVCRWPTKEGLSAITPSDDGSEALADFKKWLTVNRPPADPASAR